jgi:hypothetical protein
MRMLRTVVPLLFVVTSALSGQTYGEWDRPCTLSLSPRFSAPFNHGVLYQGYEFLTAWRSIIQTTPLPSRTWYEPASDPDPVSTDRKVRWHGAQIEGHCTIERTPYYITYHTYPVGYRGSVRPCRSGTVGLVAYEDPPESSTYDPYSSEGECAEGTSRAENGSAPCRTEYVYVEWSGDGGVTWHVIWEGFATVCG